MTAEFLETYVTYSRSSEYTFDGMTSILLILIDNANLCLIRYFNQGPNVEECEFKNLLTHLCFDIRHCNQGIGRNERWGVENLLTFDV
jgi:hypothetical protein